MLLSDTSSIIPFLAGVGAETYGVTSSLPPAVNTGKYGCWYDVSFRLESVEHVSSMVLLADLKTHSRDVYSHMIIHRYPSCTSDGYSSPLPYVFHSSGYLVLRGDRGVCRH